MRTPLYTLIKNKKKNRILSEIITARERELERNRFEKGPSEKRKQTNEFSLNSMNWIKIDQKRE